VDADFDQAGLFGECQQATDFRTGEIELTRDFVRGESLMVVQTRNLYRQGVLLLQCGEGGFASWHGKTYISEFLFIMPYLMMHEMIEMRVFLCTEMRLEQLGFCDR